MRLHRTVDFASSEVQTVAPTPRRIAWLRTTSATETASLSSGDQCRRARCASQGLIRVPSTGQQKKRDGAASPTLWTGRSERLGKSRFGN